MYKYAVLDENGFCYGESYLGGEIDAPNHILIDEKESKMFYRYDKINKKWTDEKYKIPQEKEQISKEEILKSDIEYIKCLLEVQGGI